MSRRRNLLVLVPLVLAGALGCSSDDATDADDVTTTAVTPGDSEPTQATVATTNETDVTEAPETTSDPGSTASASSDPADTASGNASDFCAPMEELANYNAESGVPDVSGDWDALQDEVLARADEGLGLYDDAIAAAPDEVRGDLETLRGYSEEVLGAVEESSSFDEFLAAFSAPSSEVEQATQELDAYISENCGFELTESTTG